MKNENGTMVFAQNVTRFGNHLIWIVKAEEDTNALVRIISGFLVRLIE